MRHHLLISTVLPAGLVLLAAASTATAQPVSASSGHVDVRVRVVHDSAPIERALIRAGAAAALTDARGLATLRLARGAHTVIATKIGFVPDTLVLFVDDAIDTALVARLEPLGAELEEVIVSSTRAERRVEDEPLRVEVLPREEIEEKLLMTPGDISMMLNETSGLRVQTTSPSLGGANVRVQGLRGRYTQILSDGLPLYGGQTGSLGLLQIPPMDLGQVEVIKGAASALYGSSALGGVINLISRRPERARELLLNQTTRGGTDVVGYLATRGDGEGASLLAGYHRQARQDVDDDGWSDLAGYDRVVVRPRASWSSASGASLFATAGATLERRTGGTTTGRTTPAGTAFREGLRTARYDIGAVGRRLSGVHLFSARTSATHQSHTHAFGDARERDRHLTGFVEGSWSRAWAVHTLVVGTALSHDRYHARDVRGVDYAFTIPAIFAQEDWAPREWLAFTASARLDVHSEYGASVSPRLSALVRRAGWTLRASGGGGVFGPTPFTEETEVVGLARVRPPGSLEEERARSAAIDVGRVLGALELNLGAFGSVVERALASRAVAEDSLELLNASGPTRTVGGEALLRFRREPFGITATYALLRSRELDVETGRRVETPLTPRQSASLVAVVEEHGAGRAGLEVYYTGRQRLDENPYRVTSPAYVIVGLLAERRIGSMRLFVNLENLGDVRQTKYDSLLLPEPGRGGRWTVDAWAPLEGRTINGGLRAEF